MIGVGNGDFRINVKDFKYFFDRATVETALDKKERRVLGRTGAYGRSVMRNSIRKARKKTKGRTNVRYAGKPPRYHVHPNTGLRLIYFVYLPNEGAVYIGPVLLRTKEPLKLKNRVISRRILGGQTVPELLNDGGQTIETATYKSGLTYRTTRTYRRFPFKDLAFPPTVRKMKQFMRETELK